MGHDEDADAAWDDDQRSVLALPVDARGIVAGRAGSGKTRVLVERVRRFVRAGLDPDAVLVLTPGRREATALRDRLALAVGGASSGPLARSVASFSFQLVRAAAAAAGDEPPQLLTGGDEDQILQDLLEGDALDEAGGAGRWPQWLGADVRSSKGFRAEVRAFFADCTALGIEPGALAEFGRSRGIEVWPALASFFAEYLHVRADLRGAHRDAAGLVREAGGIVRTGAGGASSGPLAGLKVVLVDDAQELTLGGVELLEACADRGIAVLAFGDPDIGSGAFRGASPENFARLARTLRGPVLTLRDVHRCTTMQADLVSGITQRIGAVGVIAHRAAPVGVTPDGSVRALVARSASEEYDLIARLLRERHVHDGIPWGQCAVIAHDTRQVTALEAELAAREVPTRAPGPGRALGSLPAVQDLLALIQLAAADVDTWTPQSAAGALAAAGIDPIGLRRLRGSMRTAEIAAGGDRSAGELLLSALQHRAEFATVDTREARRAARVAETLEQLRERLAGGATVHELLWLAWERSGNERVWAQAAQGTGPLAEQAGRDLDAVVALFQSAKRFVERRGERVGPADAQVFVHGIRHADVAEDRLGAPERDDCVQVLTPAGAVATQFDTVVVAGVQDGVWPNTRLRGSLLESWRLADAVRRHEDDGEPDILDRRREAMHDELRLFARAVSRASARVVVTAVDDDDTGPSVFFDLLPEPERAGAGREHPLSLRGLVAQHRRTLTIGSTPEAARAAVGQLALLADAGVPGAAPHEWYGVAEPTSDEPLRDLEREDIRVSPSRLHALEECELNWAIADLGGDAGGAVAGLGTIIHAAMEHVAGPDEDRLWDEVQARWGELEFDSVWLDRAERARARDLVRRLNIYLRDFEGAGGRLVEAEPHFEVAIAIADGDETPEHGIILSGYIDRVEVLADGSVVIVDLKTGKREPQTDSGVADNPQLAAYQLAFDSGAIAAVAGRPAGGAKLLVLRPTATRKDYATPWQPPFDDERRDLFVERIRRAAEVMRGLEFTAPFEEHCRDDHSYGLCRIHTVKAVSAS